MREGRPSATATIVACARALAGVDPLASRLVPPYLARLLPRAGAIRGPRAARALSLASLGLVDHLSLRTKAIDRVVSDAAGEGIAQLVILGAGLDARAWRMEALADALVFEIDHPSTQAFKRPRTEGVALSARGIRFVGVDFERDDLAARLAEAGHAPSERSVWVWEGVTPYLSPDAIAGSLDVVSQLSATGSVLAMTYGTPDLATVPAPVRAFVRPVFDALGEPLRGLMMPEAAALLVGARGFEIRDDARCADYAGRAGQPSPWLAIGERLLVAART